MVAGDLAAVSRVAEQSMLNPWNSGQFVTEMNVSSGLRLVADNGTVVGATVSGIPFRQRNIANEYGIRLQRFEIGLAYWYISDRGIIWAESDLAALSIYLSRVG